VSHRKHQTLFLVSNPRSHLLGSDAKLKLIQTHIESLLQNRLGLLRSEATSVAADMDALTSRIDAAGHGARVDDMKSGRWYRTAGDLRLLQNVYTFVCSTIGVHETNIQAPAEEPEAAAPGEVDEVSDE
jgi:hypothetical protein